eukprot:7387755-Prymnesium_polylepis.1
MLGAAAAGRWARVPERERPLGALRCGYERAVWQSVDRAPQSRSPQSLLQSRRQPRLCHPPRMGTSARRRYFLPRPRP